MPPPRRREAPPRALPPGARRRGLELRVDIGLAPVEPLGERSAQVLPADLELVAGPARDLDHAHVVRRARVAARVRLRLAEHPHPGRHRAAAYAGRAASATWATVRLRP